MQLTKMNVLSRDLEKKCVWIGSGSCGLVVTNIKYLKGSKIIIVIITMRVAIIY